MADEIKTLYIEPTSNCNLHCVMCSRNHWKNESTGHMDKSIFDKIISEMPDSVTRVFFGGVGEPLCHPDILYMITQAKATGRKVEMITNGTLLDEANAKALIDAELDMLWISLDSLDKKDYENIRVGANFGSIIDNIHVFNEIRFGPYWDPYSFMTHRTQLGIAFVLMKNNLSQFEKVVNAAHRFGVMEVRASHLLPYDQNQTDEICYDRLWNRKPNETKIRVNIPDMDIRNIVHNDSPNILSNPMLSFSLMGEPLSMRKDYCKFIQEGLVFVRWDGAVSPCMALLHDNTVYQQDSERSIRHCSFGNVRSQSLSKVWNSEEYTVFRQRVIGFDFSPCSRCGGCEMFESNEEDCFGSPFPTCGACLWAQGFIQCP